MSILKRWVHVPAGHTHDGKPRKAYMRWDSRTLNALNGGMGVRQLGMTHLKAWEEAVIASGRKPRKGDLKWTEKAVATFTERVAPPAEAVKRTVAALEEATSQQFEDGKAWYQVAHDMAASIVAHAGVEHPQQAAAVMAALSPGYDWDSEIIVVPYLVQHVHGKVNLTDDELASLEKDLAKLREKDPSIPHVTNGMDNDSLSSPVLARVLYHQSKRITGTTAFGSGLRYGYGGVSKSIDLLREHGTEDEVDAAIDRALEGPKVRSFYNSIIDPETDIDVAIDVWMVRLFSGDPRKENDSNLTSAPSFSVKGHKPSPIGMYPMAADVMRTATDQWNKDHPDKHLTLAQAQAVAWTVMRDRGMDKRKNTKRQNLRQALIESKL